MGIIKIRQWFVFGQGRGIVEPIARSRTWKGMYWYLIAFAVVFWVVLLYFSYYFPGAYSE